MRYQASLARKPQVSGRGAVRIRRPAPPIVHDALRSSSRSLEPATRASLESRFRYDFSKVQVHTDSTAERSARAIQARAFTVGRDVVFGEGQYSPQTRDGQRLLAHELTHVVQQDSATLPGEKDLGEPHDSHERQAAAMAERVDQLSAISK